MNGAGFLDKAVKAYKGKKVWKSIRSSFGQREDLLVVMLPEKNIELNDEIVRQIPEFMRRKGFDEVFLIISDSNMLNAKELEVPNLIRRLDEEEMEQLSAYYQLHWFYDDFIYASIKMPFGNTTANMLASKKISMGELVRSSIFC